MNYHSAQRAPMIRVLALLSLGAMTAVVASAQTAPAKPADKAAAKPAAAAAAKPAATAATKPAKPDDGKTLTLSGKDNNGKLLTRDELRACLKQRETLSMRLNDLDGARTKLNLEREALSQEQATLKTERDSLAGMKAAVDELNAKTKTFQQEVDAWNKRVADFTEAKPSGSAAEKQRTEINEQGEVLRKRQAELSAERGTVLSRGEDQIKVFNARAAAVDAKVADWNERNRKLNGEGDALQTERQSWVIDCGDKRYREDDEKAVLSGK